MSADQFQAFIAENKIDLAALSRPDSEHESKLSGPEQRALGIIKAVSNEEIPRFKVSDPLA